jgi:hypothetical protein
MYLGQYTVNIEKDTGYDYTFKFRFPDHALFKFQVKQTERLFTEPVLLLNLNFKTDKGNPIKPN